VLLQVFEHGIAEGGERRERKLLLRRDLDRAVLLATATRCRVEAALTLCTCRCRRRLRDQMLAAATLY
jgi:hypothetical protein